MNPSISAQIVIVNTPDNTFKVAVVKHDDANPFLSRIAFLPINPRKRIDIDAEPRCERCGDTGTVANGVWGCDTCGNDTTRPATIPSGFATVEEARKAARKFFNGFVTNPDTDGLSTFRIFIYMTFGVKGEGGIVDPNRFSVAASLTKKIDVSVNEFNEFVNNLKIAIDDTPGGYSEADSAMCMDIITNAYKATPTPTGTFAN